MKKISKEKIENETISDNALETQVNSDKLIEEFRKYPEKFKKIMEEKEGAIIVRLFKKVDFENKENRKI